MAQISRPFQIGLAVVVLLAGVWLFALQGHPSNSSSTSSTSTPVVTSNVAPTSKPTHHATTHAGSHPRTAASKPSVKTAHAAAGSHAQHGAAQHGAAQHGSTSKPETVTRAAANAHQAPAGSQRSSRTAASSPTTRASGTSTTHTVTSAHASPSAPAIPSGQREVEADLKQGKIVVLLFWERSGADDVVVHNQLQLLLELHRIASDAKAEEVRHADKFFGLELDKRIAVHEASPSQVTSYGSITRGVQVYSTPTLLVINPRGQVITLTGITDAFSIEQAIEEARAG